MVVAARIPLRHARFHWVERDIFVRRVVADCMKHACSLVRRGGQRKLDACCQYGVDVDLGERDAILERAGEIAGLLEPSAAAAAWFTETVRVDTDFPSGRHVRTTRLGDGCIFLAHDRRGCAIHRASLAGGWDMRGVKPHVCRLFPVSYDSDSILLSDDYADYSCAYDERAPTVYRVARDALGDVFGAELTDALDRAEESSAGPLRVIAGSPVG
jgi:Fe-S-cluster containining protein